MEHEGTLESRYYLEPAAAFVRAKLGLGTSMPVIEALSHGVKAGLDLHQFKRSTVLPRVQQVLGTLRGIAPEAVLDVGGGRGAFLWPLLDRFSDLQVTCVELQHHVVHLLAMVSRGGVRRLRVVQGDAARLPIASRSVNVITVLEVLEHLQRPYLAAREAVRVSNGFVIASVPSKDDANPEHIQVFSQEQLEELFREAGAKRVSCNHVLNHRIVVARVPVVT